MRVRRSDEEIPKVAKEQYEEAIKEYQRVTPTAGDDYATARYNIGVCHYELSRSAAAVAEYSAAIAAPARGDTRGLFTRWGS